MLITKRNLFMFRLSTSSYFTYNQIHHIINLHLIKYDHKDSIRAYFIKSHSAIENVIGAKGLLGHNSTINVFVNHTKPHSFRISIAYL